MFVSYFVAGLIPLLPYKFLETGDAFKLSIVLTLLALFVLGTVGGLYSKNFKSKIFKRGLRAVIIGGVAILVGVVVGQIAGV
jgi:VIT1/CCC1 family predicted Fe2+/Mn2+ transporter